MMVQESEGDILLLGFLYLALFLSICGVVVLWEMHEGKKWDELIKKFRKELDL